MSMGKVKLPQEVDKAINTCRMADISDYGIVALTLHGIDGPIGLFTPSVMKSLDVLRRYTFSDLEDEDIEWKVSAHDGPARADKFLQALVNGWEVEQTPEDKLREVYTKQTPNHSEGHPGYYRELENCKSFQEGITFALNTLNIKISGVNA
jgi:hypothetical protein